MGGCRDGWCKGMAAGIIVIYYYSVLVSLLFMDMPSLNIWRMFFLSLSEFNGKSGKPCVSCYCILISHI